jgi:outer membrane protein
MKRVSIIFLLLITSGFVHSQSKKWSLNDCFDYAMSRNLTIQDAQLSKNAAEVGAMLAKSQRLPSLNFNANQRLNNGTSIDPITSEFLTQTIHSTSGALNAQIPLFTGFQITNQIEQNELLVSQNSFFVEEAKNNVKLRIIQSYLQTIYNKESIAIAENNLTISTVEVENAKLKYEAGVATIRDVTDAQAQAATQEYVLIQAKNNFALEKSALKQLLELPPTDQFDIQDIDDSFMSIWSVPELMSVYQNAIQSLPEMSASQLQIEINEASLAVAKGSYYPTLALSGGMNVGYTSTQDIAFLQQMTSNYNSSLGLSLVVPIINRNQTKASTQKAIIQIEKSKLDVTNTEKSLFQKVESSWQNAVSIQNQVISAQTAEKAAKDSYDFAKRQNELGALSVVDLNISQNVYITAQQAHLQAKYLRILYKLLLDYYQGNDLTLPTYQ